MAEGIFLDGITYAAISRNLAIGKGSFWALYYRNEWTFSEHPPLMFGLQAIFFKIFGDHYLTEKIYSFVIWLVSLLLIKKIWTTHFTDKAHKYTYALPVLLWCIAPTVTWTYTNNMLDCTMAMFDLCAILMFVKAHKANANNKQSAYLIAAAIFVFAAMLTKGPVGAFPIAAPAIYWLTYNKRKTNTLLQAFSHAALLFVIVSILYLVFYHFPAAKANFDRYLHQQLFAALGGEREITGGLGRLTLAYELLIQLLPSIALGLILFTTNKLLKTTDSYKTNKSIIVFFLLIGISASLPMMMSVKQRSFYLIPALPYFVIAISMLILPYYMSITNRLAIKNKALLYFKITSICVAPILCFYLFSKVGQVGRDHQLISNIKHLQTKFPKGQVFGICQQADKDYGFLAYLQRYNQMEVNPTFYSTDYVLIDKERCNNDIIPIVMEMGYQQEAFDLEQYVLFKRKFPLKFDFILLNPVFRTRDK